MDQEFDWSEFLSFAEEVVNLKLTSCSEEAKFRAVISRAYYAGYWKARKHIERDTAYVSPNGEYKHAEIRYYFSSRNKNSLYRLIYLKLNDLYRLRILADYKDDTTISITDALVAINQTKEVIKRVGQLK